MSLCAPVLSRIFGQSRSTLPPTDDELKGFPYIVRTTDFLVFINRADNKRLFDPLRQALANWETPDAQNFFSRLHDGRYHGNCSNLYVQSIEPNAYALRKSTLHDLKKFCLTSLRHDTPDHIKYPVHSFLIAFPDVVLHPDFKRHNLHTPNQAASFALKMA